MYAGSGMPHLIFKVCALVLGTGLISQQRPGLLQRLLLGSAINLLVSRVLFFFLLIAAAVIAAPKLLFLILFSCSKKT